MAFHTLVEKFVKKTEKNCQVISLGAGFDTLYWQLHSISLTPRLYLEVDFNSVVSRKAHIIRYVDLLLYLFGDPFMLSLKFMCFF